MLTKHFSKYEFKCKCCGDLVIDMQLIYGLEVLRRILGKPIIINSAYRCPKHNKAVGGVDNSQHVSGMAADIRVIGMTPDEVHRVAKWFFVGLGLYDNFLHIDIRKGKRAFWSDISYNRKFTDDDVYDSHKLYNEGLSFREIGAILGHSASGIRYHFNKHQLLRRTQSESIKLSENKRDKTGNNNPNWKGGRSKAQLKQQVAIYAGGCCRDCGLIYTVNNSPVFEFHHLDPLVKSFNICNELQMQPMDIIKKEIDKCDLLCANCHRLRHYRPKDIIKDVLPEGPTEQDINEKLGDVE